MLIQMPMEPFIEAIVKHGQVDKMLDCKVGRVRRASLLSIEDHCDPLASPFVLYELRYNLGAVTSDLYDIWRFLSQRFGDEVDWQ